MTAPALDYFGREAADCLARLRAWREAGSGSDDDTRAARAAARALRGAAAMADEAEFAALGAAFERAARVPGGTDGLLGAALDEALAAGEASVGLPRPLGERDAERLRATAAVLAAAADALGPADRAASGEAAAAPSDPEPGAARVVPIRALARDGDAQFLVRRAAAPAATADRRFREASVPLARALRRLVAEARAAAPDGAAGPALARTLGADLHAAVTDLRELAESYDVGPAVRFFAGRAAGATALDPRTLGALEVAAAGLLGEEPTESPRGASAHTPSAQAVEPADAAEADAAEVAVADVADAAVADAAHGDSNVAGPEPLAPAAPETDDAPAPGVEDAEFRPPTGDALVALLQTGISGLGALSALEELPSPAAEPAASAEVPIGALLYRGPAALARARAVRDLLRARPGPPDAALLDELYDLLDLAADRA